MDPMLASFISETRDNLETAGRCFLMLEKAPKNSDVMDELFRSVHTIKGSSGIFQIPSFSLVVHTAEDLLDKIRAGELELTSEIIDLFLYTFDHIQDWINELEHQQCLSDKANANAKTVNDQLKTVQASKGYSNSGEDLVTEPCIAGPIFNKPKWVNDFACADIINGLARTISKNEKLFFIEYEPELECFFGGDDPLHLVMHLRGLVSFNFSETNPSKDISKLDPFKSNLKFNICVASQYEALISYFRYVENQVKIYQVQNFTDLVCADGDLADIQLYAEAVRLVSHSVESNDLQKLRQHALALVEATPVELVIHQLAQWIVLGCDLEQGSDVLQSLVDALKEQSKFIDFDSNTNADLTTTENQDELLAPFLALLKEQVEMLNISVSTDSTYGRIASVLNILYLNREHFFKQKTHLGFLSDERFESLKKEQQENPNTQMMLEFLKNIISSLEKRNNGQSQTMQDSSSLKPPFTVSDTDLSEAYEPIEKQVPQELDRKLLDEKVKEVSSSKILKVDQARIDKLMDLVGELIVAKNALPYIARRAEDEYGITSLAKEIKNQYSGLDRLVDELQSVVMQIRLVPVSSVFQRFPRLVRDLSRKLGKKIELNLIGEETEADKTIVEELADPLIHLVRNSIDHGLETIEERIRNNKPEMGTIVLRAIPQEDQVIIEVEDDGKGIDPNIIKHKAYEKGIISEERLENLSDHEAIQLVLAPGFSTAEQVSDLSGRGVGMDVVKTAIQATGGSVQVTSELGKGSCIRLSLPLSMAVSRVMMLALNNQTYGVAMDKVVETVRIAKNTVQSIRNKRAFVLRNQLIPLFNLSELLGQNNDHLTNNDELAVLVVSTNLGQIGLIIDQFDEGIDIIQKPLAGVMAGYPFYSGTALLGDGRVLLVLNVEELIACQ